MWYIYVLQSINSKRYYIGCTSDVQRRLREHNNGNNISTKHQRPWKVVYTEGFKEEHAAFMREKEIKRYKGGNAFKKLIKI